jgi:hypothetical protein
VLKGELDIGNEVYLGVDRGLGQGAHDTQEGACRAVGACQVEGRQVAAACLHLHADRQQTQQ